MPSNLFSQRLTELRKTHHLRKTDIAKLLNKKDVKSITLLEDGKSRPHVDDVLVLASYFHVSVDYLLGHETHTDPKGVRFLQAFEHLHPQDQLSILRIMSALASYNGDKR